MKQDIFVLAIATVALFAGNARAEKYMIDPVHSSVIFKVKHLVVSKVDGRFDKFAGWYNYDEKDLKVWQASATIEAGSINTYNKGRDEHLRGSDFFDTAKFTDLQFVSTKASDLVENKAKLYGNLTIKGVTKPVVLSVEVGGKVKGMRGETRTGFEATTKINRQDYGISWSKTLDGGGLAVGNDVEIELHIEGVAQ